MSHQPTDPPQTAGETVAAWLEQIAAQLRTLPTDMPPLSVGVNIQPWRLGIAASAAEQAVTAVAEALGTTAQPTEMTGGVWMLDADVEKHAPGWLWVSTYTRIEAPDGGADDE